MDLNSDAANELIHGLLTVRELYDVLNTFSCSLNVQVMSTLASNEDFTVDFALLDKLLAWLTSHPIILAVDKADAHLVFQVGQLLAEWLLSISHWG